MFLSLFLLGCSEVNEHAVLENEHITINKNIEQLQAGQNIMNNNIGTINQNLVMINQNLRVINENCQK